MSSSPAILRMTSATDQLPWLRPELPCMFVSDLCPFCCWSGKESWKSWGKPALSHSPSHQQHSPQSRLLSCHCMTNTTTGTWSAWEFFQPVFRETFLLGRVLWHMEIFFSFQWRVGWHHWCSMMGPKSGISGNDSPWNLHIACMSHQTDYTDDSDSPCISALSQACPLVKLCQKWQNWSFQEQKPS